MFAVKGQIGLVDERDRFVGVASGKDVAERDVLEAVRLPDVVVVRDL